MAKILMIVAQNGFKDEELLVPQEMFKNAGHSIKIASLNRGKATGVGGTVVTVDMGAHEASAEFFDCFVVVGGPGSPALAESKDIQKLLATANKLGKKIAGICLGPMTLAKAGVLKEKYATVFPDRAAIQLLRDCGAAYTIKNVVVDGDLVTADGPSHAAEFAKAVLEMLKK